jgi:hypothetical protein
MPFHETLGRPSFVYITGHWRRVFSRRSKKRRMAPIAARGCRPPKSSTPIRSIISSSNTRGVSQGVSSERSDLSGRREVTRVGGGYVAASLSQVQIGGRKPPTVDSRDGHLPRPVDLDLLLDQCSDTFCRFTT